LGAEARGMDSQERGAGAAGCGQANAPARYAKGRDGH
jgi:hypothetical protein